jgi:hypothetical protein
LTAYVIMQCERHLADELTGSAAASARSQAIRQRIEKHRGTVLPSATPAGGGYGSVFVTIEVADYERASALASVLRDVPGIEAAYPKPGEALP